MANAVVSAAIAIHKFVCLRHFSRAIAVRTEKWRFAEFGPDGVNGAMLFDPKADPLEMKNPADDPHANFETPVCGVLMI